MYEDLFSQAESLAMIDAMKPSRQIFAVPFHQPTTQSSTTSWRKRVLSKSELSTARRPIAMRSVALLRIRS